MQIDGIALLWDGIKEVVGKSLGEVLCDGSWLWEGIVLGNGDGKEEGVLEIEGNADGNGNEERSVNYVHAGTQQ